MQTKVFLQRVREMCQKPAEERGLLVWDVTFEKEGPRHMLTVVVDKEGGVDIDDCEYVSRAIDPLLDAPEFDSLPSYTLCVSSAGLEGLREQSGPNSSSAAEATTPSGMMARPLSS